MCGVWIKYGLYRSLVALLCLAEPYYKLRYYSKLVFLSVMNTQLYSVDEAFCGQLKYLTVLRVATGTHL